MLNLLGRLSPPSPAQLKSRFMARFAGRTLIVHEGLSIGWVSELMKEAGGGGHFRIDVRRPPDRRPTPIEWLVHRQLLNHPLPLPFLVKVEAERLLVRHLTRNGTPVHPSEINWMLGEFPTRVHLLLTSGEGEGFLPTRVLPVEDNHVEYNFDPPY
jgi:hypothetical protein